MDRDELLAATFALYKRQNPELTDSAAAQMAEDLMEFIEGTNERQRIFMQLIVDSRISPASDLVAAVNTLAFPDSLNKRSAVLLIAATELISTVKDPVECDKYLLDFIETLKRSVGLMRKSLERAGVVPPRFS